ncbi:MAG: hypothetical protein JXQ87_17270 [Bacteroidia bacterium]
MIIFLSSLSLALIAQNEDEDLLGLLGDEEETIEFIKAAFKTTRVVNSHSVENAAPGVLDLKISHRFGVINEGAYTLFGLDRATMRIGLDYGINDWLMIGGGRSTFGKTYDGFVKAKMLRQSTGAKTMPVTLALVSTFAVNTLRQADPERIYPFSNRLFYTHQLILGRKFSNNFSAQIMPSLVHKNLVATRNDANTIIALGGAIRQKLSNRVAINIEYYYLIPDQITQDVTNSLTIGFDIETGGHVFQLHFTNSISMIEKGFITETTSNWREGGIHFGFNISRVFTVRKPAEFRH